ncbi:MAG: AAC(3) family N-acetyltransferase [Polyangiaceae bacterium]|nr:AAC(3) family N-acetyltransferase [Polyangiaceae bacterium]
MVHASMRAVGGRAERVVEALLETIGPAGTLTAYVDFEPNQDGEFDLEASPAVRDHGVLAEVIRTWPGALRSANPGASMAAIGRRAAWLVADHPLDYGYGPGSPLAKLVEVDGRVLLLGADFDHVTLLHHAEHLARLPNKRIVRYAARIGGVTRTIEEYDTSDGVVASMPELYFDATVRAFVATGQCASGKVGGAVSHLIPARPLTDFAVAALERDFA